MNTDFRVSIGLTSNPKTIKLMRRCGDRSFFCLVKLWGWVAQYKPEGDLSGMDDESIEIAAGWDGEEGFFVSQLSAVGFFDGESGGYTLHDWEEHNPWAAGANARSEAASKAGKASAAKRAEKTGVKSTDSNGTSTERQRSFNERSTDSNGASTPSPSPSPNTTPPTSARVREADQDTPDQPAPPFSMTPEWQPSEFFPTIAETSGVLPPPPDEIEPALREFRAYWLTQNRKRTAHEWDLAFIKAIKSGFTAPRSRDPSKGRAGKKTGQQAKPTTYAQELAKQRNDGARRLKEKFGIGGPQDEQGGVSIGSAGHAGTLELGAP